MKAFIYKSEGNKSTEIANAIKEDLDHLDSCQIFPIQDEFIDIQTQPEIVIFLIMMQNTMNTYLRDLEKRAQVK